MIRIEIINNLKDLSIHEEAWNGLGIESGNGYPMVSYAWVASYLEHMLDSDETWKCMVAFDMNTLVGIFPIIECSKAHATRNDSDFRLPLFSDILIQSGSEAEVMAMFLPALENIDPKWHSFAMHGLRKISPARAVRSLKRRPAYMISDSDGFGSYNDINGNYADFFSSLSSNHRRNLKKAEKKLSKLKNVKFRFLEGKEADPEYLEIFMRLEGSGYKAREHEGGMPIISSPKRVAFKKALMKRLYELGWLEWHILEAGDRIIAMQMAFKMGGVLTLYKICYDETYRYCSPGKLLAGKMLERAYNDPGIFEINWISDLPFHDLWNARRRPYYASYFYRKQIKPYILKFLPRKIWIPLRDSGILGKPLQRLRGMLRR